MEIGLNTFGLGKSAGKQYAETLAALSDGGITALEPCILFVGGTDTADPAVAASKKLAAGTAGIWLPGEAAAKIAAARAKGFRVDGAHLFYASLDRKLLLRAAAFAKENGLTYYVLSFMTGDLRKAEKQIPVLREAAEIFGGNGISLLLHNHNVDLAETDGRCVFDTLLDAVPELGIELDVGWVFYAGKDCIETIEKYKRRIRILHFKDVWLQASLKKPLFTAVGEGDLPLADILGKAEELSLCPAGLVIDQDYSEGSLMADILTGAANLRHGKAAEQPEHAVHRGPLPLSLMTFPTIPEILKRSLNFELLCVIAESCGIRSLDLMDAEVLLHGKKNVKALTEKYGLTVGCLIATIPMASLPDFTIRGLIACDLKTASELGCGKLMIVPMPQDEKVPVNPKARRARWERSVKFLREAVALAEPYGITVCVEDTPSFTIPLCSIAECRATLNAVPGLKLVYDTANMLPAGDDPLAFYEALKPYICHVHLKDVDYTTVPNGDRCKDGRYLLTCPWGEGVVPVRTICERLAADGYAGTCAVEYVAPESGGALANRSRVGQFVRYLNA